MERPTNLAYDLEQFEARSPAEAPKPQITIRRERSVHPVKIVAVSVLVFMMGFTLLYSRVTINELNAQINNASSQLNVLQAEKVRMETELEGRMSLKAIEEMATNEYGMVKPDPSQVSYVKAEQESRVETAQKEESFLDRLWQRIQALFQ